MLLAISCAARSLLPTVSTPPRSGLLARAAPRGPQLPCGCIQAHKDMWCCCTRCFFPPILIFNLSLFLRVFLCFQLNWQPASMQCTSWPVSGLTGLSLTPPSASAGLGLADASRELPEERSL